MAGRLSGRTDFVVLGSPSVHAITEAAPEEVLLSRECDVLLDDEDVATLRARIATVAEPRLRAILLAWLQIALESSGQVV